MGLLQRFVKKWSEDDTSWPPPQVRKRWEEVEKYRRWYRNDRVEMAKADLNVSQDSHKMEVYTPVPWPRELARFSAALLFAEAPQVTLDGYEDQIDAIVAVNDFGAFAVEGATKVACEGRVGLRVIRDEHVSARAPLLTVIPDDQVIWDVRHGRFYTGGLVVIPKIVDSKTATSNRVVYRLLEEHVAGSVTRWLFKGQDHELGKRVPLGAYAEFAGLAEEESTGIDTPTLIPWQNMPGGESDFFGLGPIFRELNEAESLLVDRGRKSIPRLFVDRSLSDESGLVFIDGIIPVGGSRMRPTLGTGPMELIKLVQENFLSADHITWIDHVTQLMVTCAGYSPLTWGIQGKTANVTRAVSGYAMKLSQLRTLLTRAPKEHMALQALGTAVGAATGLMVAERDISRLLPTIELGDGLPPDPLDGAQEVLYLRQAVAASTETLIKTIHPTWTDDQVTIEAEKIVAEAADAVATAQGLGGGPVTGGLPASIAEAARQARAEREALRERAGAGIDETQPL